MGGGVYTVPTLNDNSWETISAVSKIISDTGMTYTDVANTWGWNVGDIKYIELYGYEYPMKLIGVNHDDKTDGGKAGMTFMGVRLLPADPLYAWGISGYNGAWAGSLMRTTLRTVVYPELTPDVKGVIVNVDKTSYRTNGTMVVSSDNLWLPSEREVSYNNSISYSPDGPEGTNYLYWMTHSTAELKMPRIDTGITQNWWLRSMYRSSNTKTCYMQTNALTNVVVNTGLCNTLICFCV